MYYLGVDTSAYTTSLAVVDENLNLSWEQRRLVDVGKGETGLAQSAAFFQHIQALPEMIRQVPGAVWGSLAGIGVSMAPRPVTGSYMPVFTAGYAVAQAMASARGLALFKTTHQEGHIAAGAVSSGLFGLAEKVNGGAEKSFLAVHLSGGTTELLAVRGNFARGFKIDLLGGTSDLHAGQFVDRIGVSLGLSFPAGKELEVLARQASPEAESLLPSSVQGLTVSFSGVETAARRLKERGTKDADIARAVEGCIARTVAKLLQTGAEQTGTSSVLIVGGVSANMYIRNEIKKRLKKGISLYWAEPDWSRDNSIGVACLTRFGAQASGRGLAGE